MGLKLNSSNIQIFEEIKEWIKNSITTNINISLIDFSFYSQLLIKAMYDGLMSPST